MTPSLELYIRAKIFEANRDGISVVTTHQVLQWLDDYNREYNKPIKIEK